MSRIPCLALVLCALVLVLSRTNSQAAAPIELPIWPDVAPGSESVKGQETSEERSKDGVPNRALRMVSTPTLTVYSPEKANATQTAIMIAPGGAYEHLAIDKEGYEVARFLADHGVTGIVLKYRLPRSKGWTFTVDTAVSDAAQGLKVIRSHASAWGIDPAKVGMMGFSAGGNLTALTSTRSPAAERPNFSVLMYPAIPATLEVSSDVPPAFLAQADDDPLGTENCIRYYAWLRAKKVPAELHLFTKGGHGFGLGKPGTSTTEWPADLINWLATIGYLPAK